MSPVLELPIIAIQSATVSALVKHGVPTDAAKRITAALIENEQCGYPSHGIMRISDYIADIKSDRINPWSLPVLKKFSPYLTVVEGNRSLNFRVVESLSEILRDNLGEGLGFISIKNAHHIGRLATIARIFTTAGYLIQGFANFNGWGQKVALPGGGPGRLATNPMVVGIPLLDGQPFILDMATSVTSEGALRQHHLKGEPVPAGWLVNAQGDAVVDAALFYCDPMQAFLSPLGGVNAGHKGFGLGLFAEIIASLTPGAGTVAKPASAPGNSVFLIFFKPETLGITPRHLTDHVASIMSYVTKGSATVRMPGSGISPNTSTLRIPEAIWRLIQELAK